MQTECVLQWEMHGGGTLISFVAERVKEGYGVLVRRDNAVLMSDVAPSAEQLFRKSHDLRTALLDIGYMAKPPAVRIAQLRGGVCWGPASPLGTLLINALT